MRRWKSGVKSTGFTLIELLVVITIIGILAAIALPNYIKAKDKAKEVQTKSAAHSIQVAVERYMVDFEKYPQWLMGGDIEGWRVWHQRYDEPNPGLDAVYNANLKDILLEHSYLQSYPLNPFVDSGDSVLRQTGIATGPGGTHIPGDGDPRFGFRGNCIGNGTDNPQLFKKWYDYSYMNFEIQAALNATSGGNPQALGYTDIIHYAMGGRRAVKQENGQNVVYTAFTHWPGNFFYQGIGEQMMIRKGWTVYRPNAFVKGEVNRYMMGVYGSYTTEGLDAIRVEERSYDNQTVYWRLPPPWAGGGVGAQIASFNNGGLPALSGGGDNVQGPWLPPDRSPGAPGSWIFGSPDGYNDAIILVLTSGDEVTAY